MITVTFTHPQLTTLINFCKRNFEENTANSDILEKVIEEMASELDVYLGECQELDDSEINPTLF